MKLFDRVPLSELIEREDGLAKRPAENKVWCLNLDQIEPHSGKIFEKIRQTRSEIGPSTYYFANGTVLYSKLRPYLNKVVVADEDGFATTELVPLRCIPEKVDARYLAYFLRSSEFLAFATQVVSGAKMPRMVMSEFWKYSIPLPPIQEQRRIAAILDKAEALRAKRREALAQLDRLAQAIFVEMFVSSDQGNWPNSTIGNLALADGGMRTGPFGSQLLHSEFVESGVAVLGIDNVVANEFRWSERRYITLEKYQELKRYTVKPGDVMISIMGTCGRCVVVPEDIPLAINTKHLCCITVDRKKCLPDFLHAFFLRHPSAKKYLEQTAKGAIMSGLNMGIIKAMPISLPPVDLQQVFVERAEALRYQKIYQRSALAEVENLFTSLQHRAFRGEL